MSKSRLYASASPVEQDLEALLRIDPGSSTSTAMQDRAAPLWIDALVVNRRRRNLGLLIGFPLALLLGVLTISILHNEGGLAAKRSYGERAQTSNIQASAPARAAAPSPVRQPLALVRPNNAIMVRNVPSAQSVRDHQQRSKAAFRSEGNDALEETPVAAARERPGFKVAEDNRESQPGKVSRNEAMVDVAKVRRVTRSETVDDIRFLKLQ